MGVEQAPTAKGKAAAKEFKQATAKDERKTEAETGRPLEKGEKRFEERSKSSDGRSAGSKRKGWDNSVRRRFSPKIANSNVRCGNHIRDFDQGEAG